MDKYLELTKNLITEFDKSSSDYLEINISDYSLTLKKGSSNPAPAVQAAPLAVPAPVMPAQYAPYAAPVASPVSTPAPAAEQTSAPAAEEASSSDLEEIKSPIVGVFYEAKDPTTAPFVKLGDSVKKGDVLCILESMKMMNEIRSDFDGVVKEIRCKNEELVEFGQVLFVLEKN